MAESAPARWGDLRSTGFAPTHFEALPVWCVLDPPVYRHRAIRSREGAVLAALVTSSWRARPMACAASGDRLAAGRRSGCASL